MPGVLLCWRVRAAFLFRSFATIRLDLHREAVVKGMLECRPGLILGERTQQDSRPWLE